MLIRRFLGISLCALCCLLAAQVPVSAQAKKKLTAAQIAQKFKYSVFTITTDKGIGTAFQTEFNMILTCYHVVKGSKEAVLKVDGKPDYPLTLVSGFDRKTDTFAFRSQDKFGVGATITRTEEMNNGEKIYVVGSPRGLEQTITEGILSGKRVEDGVRYLQISAPISPGSSGSPVINEYGEVVGIVVGSLKDAQQLNFAVHIWDALDNTTSIPFGTVATLLSDGASPSSAKEEAASPDGTGLSDEVKALLGLMDRFKGLSFEQRSLSDAPNFSVSVSDLPEELPEVEKKEVELWAVAELARLAPKATILSLKEQAEKRKTPATPKTILGGIAEADAATRNLNFTIDILKGPEGGRVYLCRASFLRPTALVSGLNVVAVYSAVAYGAFDKTSDASLVIRAAVKDTVREFSKQWGEANAEKP